MAMWLLPPDPLALWHDHRVSIFVAAVISVTAIRLALRLRWRKIRKHKYTKRTTVAVLDDGALAISSSEETREEKMERRKTTETDLRPLKYTKTVTVKSAGPRRIVGTKNYKEVPLASLGERLDPVQPLIFFSSLSGTTEKAAFDFADQFVYPYTQKAISAADSNILKPEVHDLSYIDYDDYFISGPKRSDARYFYMILLPTYNIDTQLNIFLEHLKETHHDFRIDTAPLSGLLGYSVFGFGDREGWPTEDEGFCSQAKEVDKWLAKLTGRKRAFPLGTGDVKSDADEQLRQWRLGIEEVLKDLALGRGLGEGIPGSGDPVESDEEDVEDQPQDIPSKYKRRRKPAADPSDLEDIKVPESATPSETIAIDFTTYNKRSSPSSTTPATSTPPLKEMVPITSPTHAALTKQGYTIIGSHSGVKICRWTKSALRGRGSCYKYSFYGIASHLCMETTPALACANKCVFCWRHGTNPVGTTWRWQTDPPELILAGAQQAHYAKIRALRGVPGVRADRFRAASTRIRHCALSLVGEPIFYPRINELLAGLHAQRISSFLVCNAQHPDQLAALARVTQLYVSIDAASAAKLRRIDRPLHRDFWERFCKCLDILRAHRERQRTVFRLTLVKGFNVADGNNNRREDDGDGGSKEEEEDEDDVAGYAALVARALPCFVEVKGVTYCGTSASRGAGLTMQQVPYHVEVRSFVQRLSAVLRDQYGLRYGIAAEHAHSCCVLLGDEARFCKGGTWRTWIDYDRFFELLESGAEFGPEDYVGGATPEWALDGRGGFDPRDDRVDRKGRKIEDKNKVPEPEGKGDVEERKEGTESKVIEVVS
ncbi:MAG: hypothetical protein M1821_000597 [Bathelium mastoideum]|nr:MAG: hypothetical protein M1821_000597 [Bathelium mastoideum]